MRLHWFFYYYVNVTSDDLLLPGQSNIGAKPENRLRMVPNGLERFAERNEENDSFQYNESTKTTCHHFGQFWKYHIDDVCWGKFGQTTFLI